MHPPRWLAKHWKGAGLLAHSLHAFGVVTPDVAVAEPLRPKVTKVHWLPGADVIPEPLNERPKRAAMAEASPPATPGCFVREDPSRAVVVDEPDLAALIHFHAGVAISDLVEEEAPAVGADDPDHLIHLLGSLLLQGKFVFCRHGESLPGHARAVELGGNAGDRLQWSDQ